MQKPFEVSRTPAPNAAVVLHVQGYLDAHTTPQFEEQLQAVRDGGVLRIVIDCEHLDYISSAGLGILVDTYRELLPKHGEIKVAAMTPAIRDIFDILGFSKIIHVYPSVADALDAFDSPEENA
ncbi:STAS domain-containing protein [bacterium]|nr:STAS domain-containing protein [bacterium]